MNNKYYIATKVVALSTLFVIMLSGCKVIRTIKIIHKKNVEPQYITYKDKSIIFAPLNHFGQKVFYASLKDSIISWKENGYTVFYEMVSSRGLKNVDSTKYNITSRKFIKITGGEQFSRKDYAELNEVFKNAIVQPEYNNLGIDSTDINADITVADFVSKYEELYGNIVLDSCDLNTPINAPYTCGKGLKGDLNPIIVNYRNQQLVERIEKTDKKKIVVLYGRDHIKGIRKRLHKIE